MNKNKTTDSTLAIGKNNTKAPLNKFQKEFNRLIRKTEKLRNDIITKQQKMDELLLFYSQTLQPEENEVCKEQIELVKLLHKFGKTNKLTKKQQLGLDFSLESLLDEILQTGDMPDDEEVKDVFKDVHGMSMEEALNEDYNALRDELSFFAKKNGVDMDFDWLNPDTKEEEIIRRMMEESEKMQAEFEKQDAQNATKRKNKPKTAAQLAKEKRLKEAEELKNKNLSDIYKQLAKVLHPDLEPAMTRKKEKESLMKKLTVAYKQKDLHTLLSLELAWIHNEEDKMDELADDKLKNYNEMLKNQVHELESELFRIQMHPRYEPLTKYTNSTSYFSVLMPQMRDLTRVVKTLKARKEHIQNLVSDLNSTRKLMTFKTFLHFSYENYMEEEKRQEEFNEMWNDSSFF